jgi:hypothetical protein
MSVIRGTLTAWPDFATAVQSMRGKQIGARFRMDGGARLQWPDENGRIPDDMTFYTVEDATLDGDTIVLHLRDGDFSFEFRFDIGAVMT